MKRPRLLLITTRFPFDKGEEFLKEEVIYLSKKFDVIISPWHPSCNFKKVYQLPPEIDIQKNLISPVADNMLGVLVWFLKKPTRLYVLLKLLFKELSTLPYRAQTFNCFFSFAKHAITITDKLSNYYKSRELDIIYSYWLTPPALAAVLLKKKGIAKIAIARAHRGDLYQDRTRFNYNPGQGQIITGLDRVFCISKHGLNYLHSLYPAQKRQIRLCRLGVQPAPTLNDFSTRDGRLYLVSCAYLTPIKRIHLLIDALSRLTIPITWTHLGGGEQQESLEKQALELPPNIKWSITGQLNNKAVHLFYQSNPVDLFINTSESEGLPVSIMEALSYSIPIAATDVGGTSEIVHSGKNGFLWPRDVTAQRIRETLIEYFYMDYRIKLDMRQIARETWSRYVNSSFQFSQFTNSLYNLAHR
jgi:glycosyltransferase involved in cell wall biosynthesis